MNYDYKASCIKAISFDEEKVTTIDSSHLPEQGDVVCARFTEINEHYNHVNTKGAETKKLEEGNVVVGALGNRAALKGYVGEVPETPLEQGDELAYIGEGGIFADYVDRTEDLGPPCMAEFIGYVEMDGELLNTEEYGVDPVTDINVDVPTVVVVGTRMEVGKTTLAANVIGELTDRGYRVGSLKLTGSGNERDRVKMFDFGSVKSMDFVDAGLVTTVTEAREVVKRGKGLIQEMDNLDIDVLFIEFGAGFISPYHASDIMSSMDVRQTIDEVLGVAVTILGADGLRRELEDMYYEPLSISGPITDTKTGCRKTEGVVGLPTYNAFDDEEMSELTDLLVERLPL